MPRFKFIERSLYRKAKESKIEWECDPHNPILELRAHDAFVKYIAHCRRYKIEPKDL